MVIAPLLLARPPLPFGRKTDVPAPPPLPFLGYYRQEDPVLAREEALALRDQELAKPFLSHASLNRLATYFLHEEDAYEVVTALLAPWVPRDKARNPLRKRFNDDLATSLALYGLALSYQGNHQRALQLQRWVFQAYARERQSIRYRFLDATPLVRKSVGVHANIASVYRRAGDHEQALACYQAALRTALELGALGHIDAGFIYQEIGQLHEETHAWKQAQACYEQALVIKRLWLGPAHASLLASQIGLGRAYLYQERYARAAKAFKKALDFQQRNGRPDEELEAFLHASLMQSYAGQATQLEAKARAHLTQAHMLFEGVLGSEDVRTQCLASWLEKGIQAVPLPARGPTVQHQEAQVRSEAHDKVSSQPSGDDVHLLQ